MSGPPVREVTCHTFDSPIGVCGIAWTDAGVRRLLLPHGGHQAAHCRLDSQVGPCGWAERAPRVVGAVVERVRRLLAGERVGFEDVYLDLDTATTFQRLVYAAARRIPVGAVVTYGELARRVGRPGAARAVGQALARNPVALIVPCHRVLAAGGGLGGFSAPDGVATKQRLLAIERDCPT